MSLTSGIHCPRTPLRRFLDRELSAGAHPLRRSFRARERSSQVLMPGPGVGTEAGNVGTVIDYRLRVAFTAAEPVDHVVRLGILLTGSYESDARQRLRDVGEELIERLQETVLRLQLDNRELPMDRAHDEEEDLARLLIAAAWYQVSYRTSIGFAFTPLAIAAREDPGAFTLDRLLQLPHRDMVADVVAQLYKAADSPLNDLRTRTRPEDCTPTPTFPTDRIAADADLAVDGLLLDFKSTRYTRTLRQAEAWQLTGYLLLDTDDRYRIDTVGLYLSRSGTLASWPVEEYLYLLGACRREIPAFRAAFTELLEVDAASFIGDLHNHLRQQFVLPYPSPFTSDSHPPPLAGNEDQQAHANGDDALKSQHLQHCHRPVHARASRYPCIAAATGSGYNLDQDFS
ncbi:hypothetical protein [Streptomyces pseudogriseolus]|uniref:hypothetical protein n=1 Tax=Streptomyces pseudogriseolus TaxID=36817 RepID=UPI003471C842